MSGQPYPAELRRQAEKLYVPGVFGHRQIQAVLGVPRSTIARWLNPAYEADCRAKARAYKQRHRGTCVDCGAPTSHGKDLKKPSLRCQACHQQNNPRKVWTKDAIITAMQQWAALHDGKPPTTTQWHYAGKTFPAYTTVYGRPGVFRSWSEAIAAAGFPNPRTSPGPNKQWFSRDEATKLRAAGLPDTEIGRRLGVSGGAISQALGPRGDNKRRRTPQPDWPRPTREQRIAALARALAKQTT